MFLLLYIHSKVYIVLHRFHLNFFQMQMTMQNLVLFLKDYLYKYLI
ncbi:182L [Invertebrate iridescent virus 6]|uniref:182L n=1 Tax=Invertebrate iridescent virus 6 TaxID=176652 RepID=Q91FY3_IIV6|nr:182L [Invertebrate iridescent virus 6]AAK82049.1 182L [Invertebrate iridescent virus 6]QMS79560.1 hypothetical protein IIV6-T1_182 [Invertebrate iridescent virus 6]